MEVECRAVPATLMATLLRDIEIGGGERRRSLKKFGEEQNDEAKQYGAGAASQDGEWGEALVCAGCARPGEVPLVAPETILHHPIWPVADETQP